jgi:hypothetical protein
VKRFCYSSRNNSFSRNIRQHRSGGRQRYVSHCRCLKQKSNGTCTFQSKAKVFQRPSISLSNASKRTPNSFNLRMKLEAIDSLNSEPSDSTPLKRNSDTTSNYPRLSIGSLLLGQRGLAEHLSSGFLSHFQPRAANTANVEQHKLRLE